MKNTHDDPLEAAARRHGRDADVDALARDLQRDAAVLREPLLGDVEASHDLHARDDRRHELLRRALGDVKLAVDAVANDDVAFFRLDVDIARSLADGLREEPVDPRDNRRVVVRVDDVDEVVLLERLIALELRAILLLLPDAVDGVGDDVGGRDRELDGLAEERADVVDRGGVERVGDHAVDAGVVLARRQDLVLLRVGDRQPRSRAPSGIASMSMLGHEARRRTRRRGPGRSSPRRRCSRPR